jgi:hypothetical protein
MRWFSLATCLFLFASLAATSSRGGEKDKKEPKTEAKDSHIYVIPPAGREVKVADWRFTAGTRHFTVSKDAPAKPKAKNGPEYLEFREDHSTTFQNGILTLVPLASIRKIDYDREKKNVSVTVNAGDKDETLVGTTKFIGINKLTLEGDAVLEGLGAASVKFQGGLDKGGMQSIRFPNAQPVEPMKGAPAGIVAQDKEKTKHTVSDLTALYLVDGSYRVIPQVFFKRTVKIDLDKIASMRLVQPEDKKQTATEYQVTLRDGNQHVLTLLTTVDTDKKKAMTFVGFIGRVPAGYKLFPPHTVQDVHLAEEERKTASGSSKTKNDQNTP